MTRKDYELIADTIRRVYASSCHSWHDAPTERQNAIRELANSLVCKLVADNPRFNEEIFFKACGLQTIPLAPWACPFNRDQGQCESRQTTSNYRTGKEWTQANSQTNNQNTSADVHQFRYYKNRETSDATTKAQKHKPCEQNQRCYGQGKSLERLDGGMTQACKRSEMSSPPKD